MKAKYRYGTVLRGRFEDVEAVTFLMTDGTHLRHHGLLGDYPLIPVLSEFFDHEESGYGYTERTAEFVYELDSRGERWHDRLQATCGIWNVDMQCQGELIKRDVTAADVDALQRASKDMQDLVDEATTLWKNATINGKLRKKIDPLVTKIYRAAATIEQLANPESKDDDDD